MTTKKTEAWASGRSHKPKSLVSRDGSGREYHAEGTDREVSEEKSAECSG